MLQSLSPEARAFAVVLLAKANQRTGIVKNLADLGSSQRELLAELKDAGVLLREDEQTVRLLLSTYEKTELSLTARKTRDKGEDGSRTTATPLYSPTKRGFVNDFSRNVSKNISKRPGASLQTLPINLWRGSHLAVYFTREVSEKAVLLRLALGPTPFSVGALSGQMGKWLKEGLTPAEVQGMVDLFVTDLDRHANRNVPIWKTFLARRTVLYKQAARINVEAERKAATKEDWLRSTEPAQKMTNAEWIGV